MFTSVKISFLFQSNHHKIYKSVTAFSFKNAESPTLTLLSPRKPISDCINIPFYKSVHNSLFTPVHKPFYASSIKTVPQFVHKSSIYNSTSGAKKKFFHVPVNHTICKAFITHFSKCTINIWRKTFKRLLPSLSESTVSVLIVNVVKTTATATCPVSRYTNPVSQY